MSLDFLDFFTSHGLRRVTCWAGQLNGLQGIRAFFRTASFKRPLSFFKDIFEIGQGHKTDDMRAFVTGGED